MLPFRGMATAAGADPAGAALEPLGGAGDQVLLDDRRRAAAGCGLYRTHVPVMVEVVETWSFHGNVLRRFPRTCKDGVDPNGILPPGESGIRPRSLPPDRHPDARA